MQNVLKLLCSCLLIACLEVSVQAAPRDTQKALPGPDVVARFSTGALGLYAIPERGWNGDLIVYAHGYVAFNEPLAFHNLELGDVYLPDVVQRLGFAFATTSYRRNGLAVLEGIEDILTLVRAFPSISNGRLPRRVLLVGASEGGLIMTLCIERYPQVFAGGLAMCGPIGDFKRQTDFIADFRTVFDVKFPGVLPGNTVNVPDDVIANWESIHRPAVMDAIDVNPGAAAEVLRVTRASVDVNDPSTLENTFRSLLWYQVFGSGDAAARLGGNPYDNTRRVYRGSSNDAWLNQAVGRFSATPVARANLGAFETTGRLARPLVTMHTTGDELVPFWHEVLYYSKAKNAGGLKNLRVIPISRYGHCNFTINDLFVALAQLFRELK